MGKLKNTFIAILMGLSAIGAVRNSWGAPPAIPPIPTPGVTASDVVCTECVNETDIAAGAVTEPKLATGAVTNGKIADGAVTDAKITGPISGTKLGSHTHNGSDIVDGTIGTSKISDGAVSNSKLADWSVSGTKIVDYSVTDTKIASGAVIESKIADGSVSGVKISDGAVTDAKITGPISTSKIEKPASVVVVAKSGGDFTSIQAAIDSINPTAENPYLIKVTPGIYYESIILKSYIHLQGAGQTVTIIKGPVTDIDWTARTITLNNISNVLISNLTVKFGYSGIYIDNSSNIIIRDNTIDSYEGGYYPSWHGIFIRNSSVSVTITNNTITNYGYYGIWNIESSSATITENSITGNRRGGITNQYSSAVILGNTITNNGVYGFGGNGITNSSSSPLISGNTISNNAYDGILNSYYSSPKILNNNIVNNSRYDISIWWEGCAPNISFNVYDTLLGATGFGMYNVKSDGTAATEP